PGKTLTINHASAINHDRLRLYGAFTNDANLVLNNGGVWMAPYVASGTQQYNGLISGSGGFVNRAGGSTIIFNNTNIFTGDARITTGGYGIGVDSVVSGGTMVSSPLGLGSLVLTNESDGVGGNGALIALNGPRILANPIAYSRSNEFTLIIAGTNDLTLSGGIACAGQLDGLAASRTLQVDNTGVTRITAPVQAPVGTYVYKTGAGTLLLNSSNTYGGGFVVSNGVFGGTGSLNAVLGIAPGATLSPGDNSIGKFTVNNGVSCAGTLLIEIDKNNPNTNDSLFVTGSIGAGASTTVVVTNLGPALVAGNSFKLANVPVSSGDLATITPAPGAGLVWTNLLAVNGSIAVISTNAGPSIPTTPTNLVFAASGGNLNFSWPSNYIGWTLQVQTNLRSVGLVPATNAWFDVAGSTTTNQAQIPVSSAAPTVFYRLFYRIP
ncbi:MAG: hypothetical protein RLY20_3103, partial [Verrucomicrobiota bacterium]